MERFVEVAIRTSILVVSLGMLVPWIRSEVVSRDVEQAESDVAEIAEAIRQMTIDTEAGPTRGPRGTDGELYRLIGPGKIAPRSYFRSDRHQGWLADHLVVNEPHPGRPYDGWAGPYLTPQTDPWGYAYVAVIHPLGHPERGDCVVVSAGPNRIMDADYASPHGVLPAGDDVVHVIDWD